jgi:hypothetical protein
VNKQLLIPLQRYQVSRGRFTWPASVNLASPSSADVLPLSQLASQLRGPGRRVTIERNAFGQATVRIRRDSAGKLPREGYRLSIAPGAMEIVAADDAGAYYAVATLRELADRGRSVGAAVIEDWPVFRRRGVYLDCSRGKVPTLQRLRDVVNLLAGWKVNELQLYIENVFQFHRHPQIGRGYSPFSPADLLEIQDYCRQRHIRFVGSLASFGHMERILRLGEYMHLSETGDRWGSTLCPTDPASIGFLSELYEEFVPLFEAVDFNACGDEPWDLGKGRSKRRCEKMGVGQVYLEFLLKIRRLCQQHGKRLNVWGDIVLEHGDLLDRWPKDVVMLNWDYQRRGQRIARTREITDAGLEVVVCPGTNAWGSHGCRMELGMDNIANFAAEGVRCKAAGLLNTDWGDGWHRNMLAVSLHNLAWGAAQSWRPGHMDHKAFTERFCRAAFPGIGPVLAGAIRRLGGTDDALGLPDANSSPFYNHALTPLKQLVIAGQDLGAFLDGLSQPKAAAWVESLGAIRWPQAPAGFARQMMQEFELATRQEHLAVARLALAGWMRTGRQPARRELLSLARQTDDLSRQFQKVWLLGNRPSRLVEILKRLRASAKEYRRLARK